MKIFSVKFHFSIDCSKTYTLSELKLSKQPEIHQNGVVQNLAEKLEFFANQSKR